MAEQAPPSGDEFFVGWLRAPAGYVRFLRPVVVLLLVTAPVLAALAALAQRPPGAARWEADALQTFDGVVTATPYAMIRVPGERPGEVRTILLVEEGKFGAAERVRPFDGRAVRVAGTLLHRDDRWMLELAAGDEGVRPIPSASPLPAPEPSPPRRVMLRGEIIDSKCYLGAMKPGGGKTHKACAALCLTGGVPPMFVTRDADGRETYHLLTGTDGAAAGAAVIPFVGDPVEVAGVLERHGDLLVLKVDPAEIRRR